MTLGQRDQQWREGNGQGPRYCSRTLCQRAWPQRDCGRGPGSRGGGPRRAPSAFLFPSFSLLPSHSASDTLLVFSCANHSSKPSKPSFGIKAQDQGAASHSVTKELWLSTLSFYKGRTTEFQRGRGLFQSSTGMKTMGSSQVLGTSVGSSTKADIVPNL